MHIHHVAIWTQDLEKLKSFYETYFDAKAGDKYTNPAKKYESYFLTFDSGAKLELMHRPDIPMRPGDPQTQCSGYTHISIAIGSVEQVDHLTSRLQNDGYALMDGPRRTGDGYYESLVLDPDGNRVEITV
jgi:lactoylglutathione lyase